jgi:hypothetical protein
VINPQILDVENHDNNEWVLVSYRRWWCPWFRINQRFFSGAKWNHLTFANERGKSFEMASLRNLITIYEAEQEKVAKLLEARDLPEGMVTWKGKLTRKTYAHGNVWFEPENERSYCSWLIEPKNIPVGWIEHRVRITMELLP